jgi:hypothetical protein
MTKDPITLKQCIDKFKYDDKGNGVFTVDTAKVDTFKKLITEEAKISTFGSKITTGNDGKITFVIDKAVMEKADKEKIPQPEKQRSFLDRIKISRKNTELSV